MRNFIIILLLIHGLIHLMGFIKSIKPDKITAIKTVISKPIGLFWLTSAVLFLIAIYFLLTGNPLWWIVCSIAVIISQVVIIISWQDAKFGTLPNIVLLILIYTTTVF